MGDYDDQLLKPASQYSQRILGVSIFAAGIPVLWLDSRISFCTGIALAVGCFKLSLRRTAVRKAQGSD